MPTVRRGGVSQLIVIGLLALRVPHGVTAQTFVTTHGMPAFEHAMLEAIDLDSDGVPEFFLSGVNPSGVIQSRIVRLESRAVDPDGRVEARFGSVVHPISGLYRGDAAAADYTGDGYPDLLVTGMTLVEVDIGQFAEQPATILARNAASGAGGRTLILDTGVPLPALYDSGAAWGDYDGDGDPDLVLAGRGADGEPSTYLFRNDRDGGAPRLIQVDAGLPDVYRPGFDWGDYDGDGDLDLIVTGLSGADVPLVGLYRNDGGFFANVNAGLPQLYMGEARWGDYDADGDLDLLLAGAIPDPHLFRSELLIYVNESESLRRIDPDVPSGFAGRIDWIDLDADGDLEVSVMGVEDLPSGEPSTRLYRRTDVEGALQPLYLIGGVLIGTSQWVDYDGNGRPDLLVVGRQVDRPASLLFEF